MKHISLITTLAILCLAVLAGCGGTSSPTQTHNRDQPKISQNSHHAFRLTGANLFASASSPVVGEVLTTTNGTWSNNPTSFSYQWQRCTGGTCSNISGATSNSYTVNSADLNNTIDVVVTASNSGGSNSQTSAATGVVTASSTTVGATGEPVVTCSTTLNPGANVQNALASAVPGAVICLNAGNWSKQTISNVTQGVTLAAAPAAVGQVNMAGLATTGTVSNLTVEGLKLSDGIFILGAAVSDTFQNNTLENWGAPDAQSDSAFFLFPGDTGAADNSVHGISMSFNQIDHVPQCLQDDTSGGNTFSHNVCGPGIGNGGSPDVHYTQAEGMTNETINNNAFEGPLATGAAGHINVIHGYGTTWQINNNIMWHVDGNQHLQLGDDGPISGMQVENNLDIESSGTNVGVFQALGGTVSNATVTNNTVVGPVNNATGSASYTIDSINIFTFSNNIGIQDNNGDFAVNCSGTSNSCTNNVDSDGSAPGTSAIHSWTPNWQNTTWTPNSGSPWNPPPANYYKPVAGGGVTSAMGYQGSIGP